MRIYTKQQVRTQEDKQIIWSVIFNDYQEIEIGNPVPSNGHDVLKMGYSIENIEELGQEYGLDLEEDVLKEWVIISLSKFWKKDESRLFDTPSVWENIKSVQILSKETNYVLLWTYGEVKFVTPFLFDK